MNLLNWAILKLEVRCVYTDASLVYAPWRLAFIYIWNAISFRSHSALLGQLSSCLCLQYNLSISRLGGFSVVETSSAAIEPIGGHHAAPLGEGLCTRSRPRPQLQRPCSALTGRTCDMYRRKMPVQWNCLTIMCEVVVVSRKLRWQGVNKQQTRDAPLPNSPV